MSRIYLKKLTTHEFHSFSVGPKLKLTSEISFDLVPYYRSGIALSISERGWDYCIGFEGILLYYNALTQVMWDIEDYLEKGDIIEREITWIEDCHPLREKKPIKQCRNVKFYLFNSSKLGVKLFIEYHAGRYGSHIIALDNVSPFYNAVTEVVRELGFEVKAWGE